MAICQHKGDDKHQPKATSPKATHGDKHRHKGGASTSPRQPVVTSTSPKANTVHRQRREYSEDRGGGKRREHNEHEFMTDETTSTHRVHRGRESLRQGTERELGRCSPHRRRGRDSENGLCEQELLKDSKEKNPRPAAHDPLRQPQDLTSFDDCNRNCCGDTPRRREREDSAEGERGLLDVAGGGGKKESATHLIVRAQ